MIKCLRIKEGTCKECSACPDCEHYVPDEENQQVDIYFLRFVHKRRQNSMCARPELMYPGID